MGTRGRAPSGDSLVEAIEAAALRDQVAAEHAKTAQGLPAWDHGTFHHEYLARCEAAWAARK